MLVHQLSVLIVIANGMRLLPCRWRPHRAGRPRYAISLYNISAMSFGSLSGNAILALNAGARKGGFAHDTGEGSISRYHRQDDG